MGIFKRKNLNSHTYNTSSYPKNNSGLGAFFSGKRKLLILLSAVVISFILILVAWSPNKSKTDQTTYEGYALDFLTYVQNNDSKTSYSLFDPAVHTAISDTEWQSRVKTLSSVFGNSTPEHIKTVKIRPNGSETGNLNYLEQYRIKGTDGTYIIEVLLTSEKEPTVLNFSSKRESSND